MPVKIDGQVYYRTSEACRMAGISRATLARWVNSGFLGDTKSKRVNGLFEEKEITKVKAEANRIKRWLELDLNENWNELG